MSTKFTQKDLPMVESPSLQIFLNTGSIHLNIARLLAQKLETRGYKDITPPILQFLGAMECGPNYAADIARYLNISRQMAGKTVRELSNLGYLEQRKGKGRQKEILFTDKGQKLISDTRASLLEMDKYLKKINKGDQLDQMMPMMEDLDNLLKNTQG